MQCLVGVVVVLWSAAASSTGEEWWRTASIYQIYPRSFKDSDGDGVGDLKGIEQKASYFKELGVQAVWLSPIQNSPMADFGYDISNFTGIDPIFGTMDDFKSLCKTLGNMGLKILLDFVPNHTSEKHPWFQMSLNKTDPYTDFYVWVDGNKDTVTGNHTPPNNWKAVYGDSAWQWSEQRQQYYLHQFVQQQPDLDYRNPKVIDAMEDVIRFWLDMGVDGFRVDSAKHLFENKNFSLNEPVLPGTNGTKYADLKHIYTTDQPETFDLLERWGQIFYSYSIGPEGKPRIMLEECYDDVKDIIRYYGQGNTSLMIPFNFELLGGGGPYTRAFTYKKYIDEWMTYMPKGGVANWVVGNHDQKRVATACGPEMVDSINMVTSYLPGIKLTYNGEEIGMVDTYIRWDQTVDPAGLLLGPDHYQEGSRDPARTPLQWDDSFNAGFSTSLKTWLPVNPNYWWLNVAAQRSAQYSHLKVFQTMMKVRKDPVLKYGDLTTITPNNDTFIALRSYNSSSFLLIMNMASVDSLFTSQSVFAPLKLDQDMEVVATSSNVISHQVGDILKTGYISLLMRPKATIILRSPPSNPSSATAFTFTPLLLIITLLISHCE